MRTILAVSFLFVVVVFGRAQADSCCKCSKYPDAPNSKKQPRRTYNGGKFSADLACGFFCEAQVSDPSHSLTNGRCDSDYPNHAKDQVVIDDATKVCRKFDREKNLSNYDQCLGACGTVHEYRDKCVAACGDDQGCKDGCSGACNDEGCRAGCAGAKKKQNVERYNAICRDDGQRPSCGCEDWLKGKEGECVGGCLGDKGCEDGCHSACFGDPAARSGACNESRRKKPCSPIHDMFHHEIHDRG